MEIAICVIAYNRLHALKRVLNDLLNSYYNQSVTLIISVDKSNTTEVGAYSKAFHWPYGEKRCIIHKTNLGLRKHILSIGTFLEEYDALVVLEDDISVAPNFYNYVLKCVEKYRDNENIAGISLYNFPLNYHNNLPFYPLRSNSDIYLMQNAMSWGQVWMKTQWKSFMKWYENNSEEFAYKLHLPKSICSWGVNSWLKYHTKYCIENNKYFVYPYSSLSTNNSDKGVHNAVGQTRFQAPLFYGEQKNYLFNECVKYDAFFESEILYEVLNLDKSMLCVDFYGLKENRLKKRFFLTRKCLNYRIVSSYALDLKPYEMNIIKNRAGNELFLYDTSESTVNINKNRGVRSIMMYKEYLYAFDFRAFFVSLLKDFLAILR